MTTPANPTHNAALVIALPPRNALEASLLKALAPHHAANPIWTRLMHLLAGELGGRVETASSIVGAVSLAMFSLCAAENVMFRFNLWAFFRLYAAAFSRRKNHQDALIWVAKEIVLRNGANRAAQWLPDYQQVYDRMATVHPAIGAWAVLYASVASDHACDFVTAEMVKLTILSAAQEAAIHAESYTNFKEQVRQSSHLLLKAIHPDFT